MLNAQGWCLSGFKVLFFLMIVNVSHAESLKAILKYSLVHDPVLLEARADEEVAENRVEQAKSLRWPTVSLTGSGVLGEKHKDSSDYANDKITPGLQVKMNVYSFGAVDAEIKKNESSRKYYRYKHSESREELGYTIGDLYLTALNAKQSIEVLENSLARHDDILGDIEVIVDNDRGRESEYVQAQSRQIMVNQQINDYRRLLDTTLSSLAKYTRRPIAEKDLVDPFGKITEEMLKTKYTLGEGDESPSYLAQQAELESKAFDFEAEKAKQMPTVNVVGTATPDDQTVMLDVSWDVFNRSTKYTIREKASLRTAAERRLERVARDVEETARLALIEMQRNRLQMQTLKKQMKASEKVVDFYKLQFSIARKTLIEVLNAESELSNVEITYTNTKNEWNRAVLSYLRSQGKIAEWAGMIAE